VRAIDFTISTNDMINAVLNAKAMKGEGKTTGTKRGHDSSESGSDSSKEEPPLKPLTKKVATANAAHNDFVAKRLNDVVEAFTKVRSYA